MTARLLDHHSAERFEVRIRELVTGQATLERIAGAMLSARAVQLLPLISDKKRVSHAMFTPSPSFDPGMSFMTLSIASAKFR